jgi:hypothetical protein
MAQENHTADEGSREVADAIARDRARLLKDLTEDLWALPIGESDEVSGWAVSRDDVQEMLADALGPRRRPG